MSDPLLAGTHIMEGAGREGATVSRVPTEEEPWAAGAGCQRGDHAFSVLEELL